jgi:hypothetical protein
MQSSSFANLFYGMNMSFVVYGFDFKARRK